MAKNIEQHYIPRVYLKHFQIDDTTNKSRVFCIDFSNKYDFKIEKKGINDKVFKERKFYSDNRLIDPLAIENVLGRDFEPKYENIIKNIELEITLSAETIEDLMTWLYISKLRSPYFRVNSERILERIISITNAYKGHVPSEEEKMKVEKYIKKTSKEIHLNSFSDVPQVKELLELHFQTLNTKHWRILKSYPDFPFWTNDNPGFSPNTNPMFVRDKPFHQVMELNANSTIFYVLTPKYCIEMTPFQDVATLNMDITFEQATPQLIAYVNQGVFYSRYKLLISNSKKLLDHYIKFKPKNI